MENHGIFLHITGLFGNKTGLFSCEKSRIGEFSFQTLPESFLFFYYLLNEIVSFEYTSSILSSLYFVHNTDLSKDNNVQKCHHFCGFFEEIGIEP